MFLSLTRLDSAPQRTSCPHVRSLGRRHGRHNHRLHRRRYHGRRSPRASLHVTITTVVLVVVLSGQTRIYARRL